MLIQNSLKSLKAISNIKERNCLFPSSSDSIALLKL